jgi:hypothetical protein
LLLQGFDVLLDFATAFFLLQSLDNLRLHGFITDHRSRLRSVTSMM